MKQSKYLIPLVLATVPLVSFAASNSYGFPDPFAGASIQSVIGNVIRGILTLVGVLFFLMFLWGGWTYMTAGGDSSKVQSAKTTLMNAVIGLIIIALSYAIVFQIIDAIGRAGSGAAQTTVQQSP